MKKKAGATKHLRHQLEWLGCALLAWLIPKLPRKACVALANALGALAFTFDKRGRTVALANLDAVFGERFNESQRKKIACASFQNFARTMIDLFWSPSLAKNPQRWLHFENIEAFRALQKSGRGFAAIVTHVGGFEWASLACGFEGSPGLIVAESFKNARLTAIFKSLREVSSHEMIPQENSIIRMLKHTKRRGAVGALVDLNVPPTQAATVIEAFGMEMCVTILHAVIAQRAQVPLLPITTEPRADGSCVVRFHEPLSFSPETDLQKIAQTCWNAFEPVIGARPEFWMWAYKHWRYKPSDAQRPYPFYANASSKFEKLRRVKKT